MTEEIIIDGVNVSECKYLNKVVNEEPYCNIDEEHLYTCSSDENCYYKQLKRLEQENKEEKKAYNECMHYLACMTEQRNKLKTALEEMREIANENNFCASYACPPMFKILDRINEVLK